MKTVKNTLVVIGIIVAMAFVAYIAWQLSSIFNGEYYYATIPVGTSLKDIHELYTEEFMYEKISENKDPHKILGDKVKIGNDVVIYSYGGVLQVGVDMDQAQYERDGDTITVTFPNWIGINDLSDVHYYKVSQKTLSQEKISNYNQSLIEEDRENIQREAIKKGVLDRAEENLEEKLAGHYYEISSMVYTEDDDDYDEYDGSEFEIEVVIEEPDKVEWKKNS